jgi:hypothetical protein
VASNLSSVCEKKDGYFALLCVYDLKVSRLKVGQIEAHMKAKGGRILAKRLGKSAWQPREPRTSKCTAGIF